MTDQNTIAQLLTRLSEAAPEVCQRNGIYYLIGDYVFKAGPDGLIAYCDNGDLGPASGPPALDWLAGAVMRACEAGGLNVDTSIGPGIYTVYLSQMGVKSRAKSESDLAATLLAAFVAACEAR